MQVLVVRSLPTLSLTIPISFAIPFPPPSSSPIPLPLLPLYLLFTRLPLQQPRHFSTRIPSLKPRPVQKPKIRRARRLARKPQPAHIRAQILMHLQRRARGPIRVTAVRPRLGGPFRERERNGLGDLDVREHLAEDGEELGLGLGWGLALDAVCVLVDDGGEEDGGVGEERVAC